VLLEGTAAFVQDARRAGLFVVAASQGGAVALYAVPADEAGVIVRPDHIVDLTRDQGRVAFDGVRVPASSLVAKDGSAAIRAALPAMLTLVAADMVGAAEWQLQTTTEYAKV